MTAPSSTTSFAAWQADGGQFYKGGDSVTITHNTIFTAHWTTGGNTYSVAFNTGNGQGTQPVNQQVPGGETVTLPDQGSMIAPSGTIFAGWKAGTTDETLAAGASVPINAGTTFYAQWVSNQGLESVVTFSTGDGTGKAPDTKKLIDGVPVTLPGQGEMTPPEGRTFFRGWQDANSGSLRAAGTSVPITGPTTFTAQWAIGCEVTFNRGTGAGGEAWPTQTVAVNSTMRLPGQGTMINSGKTFVGWTGGGSTAIRTAGASVSITASFTTFTAYWITSGGGSFNGSASGLGVNTATSANNVVSNYISGGYNTLDAFIAAGGHLYVNGTEVISGSETIRPTDTVIVAPPSSGSGNNNGGDNNGNGNGGGNGDLVEYFDGKLTDFGMNQAMPVDTLLGMGATYMGIEGVSTLAGLRASGGHLYINGTEVTSGTRVIQPTDTVRILAPSSSGNGSGNGNGNGGGGSVDSALVATWHSTQTAANNGQSPAFEFRDDGSLIIAGQDGMTITVTTSGGRISMTYTANGYTGDGGSIGYEVSGTSLKFSSPSSGQVATILNSSQNLVNAAGDGYFHKSSSGGNNNGGNGSGNGNGGGSTYYTVTFNPGMGSGSAPSSRSVESGGYISLPGQGSMIAPYEYAFAGWSTGGWTYEPYEGFIVTGNTVFTAQWDYMGGGGGGGTVGDITGSWTGYVNGSSVTLTFDSGFYLGSGLGGSSDSGYYTMMTDNTATLYNTSQGAGYIGTATVTSADTMELFLPGGYYPGTYQFTRSGSSGGGDFEEFSGTAEDILGITVPISVNELMGGSFAAFTQVGGKLSVNGIEVISGSTIIYPDDWVTGLVPVFSSEYNAKVLRSLRRFSRNKR
jgi:hypothetical protein